MSSRRHFLLYVCYINLTFGIILLNSGIVRSTNPLEYGNFSMEPPEEEIETLFVEGLTFVHVTFPHCALNYTKFETLAKDERIISVRHKIIKPNPKINGTCYSANVTIKARNIGTSNVTFRVVYPTTNDPCKSEVEILEEYEINAQRKPKLELLIFRFGTMFFLVILNFGFGCSLDIEVVKEILKRPFAPAVGFTCQYVLMPILGFCVAMTLLRENPLFGFGLICSSCAPGGAGSNVWCLLLGGDVNLSLTMTFFSITASLVMMPLWIYVEGRFFIDTSTVAIPYLNILGSLLMFVVPLFIGIIFRKFKERGAALVGKCIKPFAFIFVGFLLTFGLYVNRYIYSIIGAFPFILIPALLQPYLGFGFGFGIARTIGKQEKKRAITIAIETGVQNIAIPMVLLQNSFVQPLGDIAATMPATTAHFTPLPLFITFLVLLARSRFCPPKAKEQTETVIDAKDEDELNRHVIEPIEVAKQSTKPYYSFMGNSNENNLFLPGYNNAELGKRYSELDHETNI